MSVELVSASMRLDALVQEGVPLLGWEATLPLSSKVPVMKTRSRSNPSQVLPLLMHLEQKGRSLVHCGPCQLVFVAVMGRGRG